MTRKADFNAEEWQVVAEGPLMAGLCVMAADSGGTIRESVSMAETYAEARQRQGSSELLDELVRVPPQLGPDRFSSPDAVHRESLEHVGDAIRVLATRATPDELDAYRRFVEELAQRVARAHKEGGVLGFGGKEISDAEQVALDEVAARLQTPTG